MTKEEYEKKIDELQAQIDELKNTQIEEKPTPPNPRWKPNEGEEVYYVIGTCGDVCFQSWTNDEIDNKRLSCGNVFMTREAAEFAAERRKVLAEMREWAGRWQDPYRIIYIDGKVEPETVYIGRCISYGELRFGSEADAINCIKTVGEERIKKYYFMITEV